MSQAAVLEAVLGFIKNGNLQPGSKPGFAHALKLSYNTIAKERLSLGGPNNKELIYRYRFCNHVPAPSTGLLTALMDELSTDAVFRAGMPAAPGLSLQMHTEMFVNDLPISDIDVVNRITKLGRIITHTQTDFICVDTGKILGQGSHIKYMPSGSRILDFICNNKTGYTFFSKFLESTRKLESYPEKSLIKEVIKDHLEFEGLSGKALFHCTREHTNPMGSMHGGCHAMVMEQVATVFAKAELNTEMTILDAMHIEYLKAAKGTVQIVCDKLGRCEKESLHVRVRIQQPGGGKIFSEGKLRFSVKPSKSNL